MPTPASTQPLVSICCLAYNQKDYIRQAIEGMLMQQTAFPTEIIIHDDASTDGTDQIIRHYVEQYPERITAFYEQTNQYAAGYKGRMAVTFLYPHAKGEYIAYCETRSNSRNKSTSCSRTPTTPSASIAAHTSTWSTAPPLPTSVGTS